MNFGDDDQASAAEVEDRRGMRFPGGGMGIGGGLGLVGLIIVGVVRLLGGDVVAPSGQHHQGPRHEAPRQAGAETRGHAPISGSCAHVTSETDQGKFVACVEHNVQRFWATQLDDYRPAKLVLFTEATESGCGEASAATGPFYCPKDEKVYLDTGFFDELHRRFHARGGDFAEAYVVAHEYGHHIQRLKGVEARVRHAEARDPERANEWSVALELQADCYAGVWGHAAYAQGKVDASEISEALDAAAAVGDDRIQKQATGHVRPERFTHGSAAQRVHWFRRGMDSGDSRQCDTFASL